MDWMQSLAIIGSNVAMFISMITLIQWARTESRNDFHSLDTKIDANRVETHAMVNNMFNSIQAEIKDFHGRLCAIEEKKNQERAHRRRK